MNKLVLLTGGNLGDRLSNLHNAKEAIEHHVGVLLQSSPIIQSEAWGFESENAFLNQVLVIETELSANNVLEVIQQIERDLGRVRKSEQWISRLIDIDILFFNNEQFSTDDLNIPHMHIQDRRFTLLALNTIMPDYLHPVYHKTVQELLEQCSDKSKVEVYHA